MLAEIALIVGHGHDSGMVAKPIQSGWKQHDESSTVTVSAVSPALRYDRMICPSADREP